MVEVAGQPAVEVLPLLPWSLAWMAPFIASAVMAVLWLYGVKRDIVYAVLAVAGIAASAAISTVIALRVFGEGVAVHVAPNATWIPWIDVGLGSYFDGLSTAMALVVSWVSLAIAIYSVKYMEGDPGYARYFFMFSFFVGSMMLLVVADNLVLMFIGWEGTGIASYALIGHWYTDEEDKWVGRPGRIVLGTPMYFEPSHSALRAILFTRVGDIGLIVGIALLYLYSGTFSIPQLAAEAGSWLPAMAADGVLALGMLVLTLGAFAKSAQVPFHEWLVTAMTGPTPVSALIHAATMVKAGVFLVFRLTPILVAGYVASGAAAGDLALYFWIVAVVAAATALLPSLMALVADELKLILAYSTASQLGYMMLAAAAGGLLALSAVEPVEAAAEGVAAGFAQLLSHSLFKAALFLAAGWVLHVAHTRFIDGMGGYARVMKATALAFWLAGLSLAGIPPLSGFFTKEAVIEVALSASPILGVIAAATAVVTAAYTTRMVVRIFHLPPYEHPGHGGAHGGEAPPLMLAPYLALALATLMLGLAYPQLYGFLGDMAALTLSSSPVELALKLKGSTIAVAGGAVAGVAVTAALYMALRVDFRGLIAGSGLASAIHGFLYDRMYINPVIYIVVVGGFAWLTRAMVELDLAFDTGYHLALVSLAAAAAWGLRAVNRGRTDYILALYLISLALTILYALFTLQGMVEGILSP